VDEAHLWPGPTRHQLEMPPHFSFNLKEGQNHIWPILHLLGLGNEMIADMLIGNEQRKKKH